MHSTADGCLSRRDAVRLRTQRNMMAKSNPLVASAYPPEGYRQMTDHDAVRAWLASFGGTIASADYADEMMDAGYDTLDNMIFTKDELMDACAKLSDKPGHAGCIARDAAKMIEEIGSVGPEPPQTELEGTGLGLGLPDAVKVAGDAPPFPSGVGGKQVTRSAAEEWLDREIVWCRKWSKQAANALVLRRDRIDIGIESIRSAARLSEEHETYLGAQLLGTIGEGERVHLTRTDQDRCMGLDMIDTLLSRYMKMNVAHIAKIHDNFTQQKPVEDARLLSARLAQWKDQRVKLRNAGQAPTDEIQLGSLGKVMEKMKDVKAAAAAAQVIKGQPLSLYETLTLLENVADQVDMDNEDGEPNAKPKAKPKPTPNPPPTPFIPNVPGPIVPTVMQGSARPKSGKPCLHWVLTKLGGECRIIDKCPHEHDPKMKGSNAPEALTIAKGIKCRHHPGCKFGDDCCYSHE